MTDCGVTGARFADRRPVGRLLRAAAWSVVALLMTSGLARGQISYLFQETFQVLGTKLDLGTWTTEIGASSFLGRTQLADWVTPGGVGQFIVGSGGAELALNTYNPTGSFFYGTHGKTLTSFQPSGSDAIVLSARLQLTSLQRGIVYGIYLYGCPSVGDCAQHHDEIDIELVTNQLQFGAPMRVQLNRYADEPLGAGNGIVADLPPGFDPLAVHEWTIVWSLTRVSFSVDGVLLAMVTTHIPQGRMQANINVWAPDSGWPDAYNSSLQPVGSAAENQRFFARVTAVTVHTSTVSPRHNDVNGDGSPDLVWRNTGSGANVVWYLNGTTVLGQAGLPTVSDPAWQLIATADMNADGRPDAIWRNTTTGANVVWYLDGPTVLSQVSLPPVTDLTWQLVASADVNRDESPDLIWRNQVSGANVVWYLSGVTVVGQANIPTVSDLSWTLAASADMNADGSTDLLWRNVVTGADVVWYMNGVSIVSQGALPTVPDLAWTLAAALDVSGDGIAELFWRHRGRGVNQVWSMTGTTVTNMLFLAPVADTSWRIAGPTVAQTSSDFNGDQHPDLVWRNTSTGENVVWHLNGTTLVSQAGLPSVPDPSWQRVATTDLIGGGGPGSGYPDLIWRNSVTGANVVWFLNGTTLLNQFTLPGVPDLAWQLVTTADINEDATPDLIWRNTTTGANVIWFMSATTVTGQGSLPSVADPAWRIAASADVNGDGHADLIWRNATTGANVVWYLSGPGVSILSQVALQPVADLSWQIAMAADVNGDSHPDLIWRNTTTGENVVWFLNGTALLSQSSLQSVPDTSWTLRP